MEKWNKSNNKYVDFLKMYIFFQNIIILAFFFCWNSIYLLFALGVYFRELYSWTKQQQKNEVIIISSYHKTGFFLISKSN
jgi:hypothetical protein